MRINIYDPDATIAAIDEALARDAFATAAAALEEARRRVLMEYNIFAVASRLCGAPSFLAPAAHRLRPEEVFRDSLRRKLSKRLRRAIPRRYRRPASAP